MSDMEQIQKIAETNQLLWTLMVNHASAIGKIREKELKSLPEEGVYSAAIQQFPPNTQLDIDAIALNILQLIDTEDKNCLKAVENYDDMLKVVFSSYPSSFKKDLPEGNKLLLQALWKKVEGNNTLTPIVAGFTNTLHLIYNFSS